MDHLSRFGLIFKKISQLTDHSNTLAQDEILKQYWMPDESCKECFECNETFTTFRRKHHCRICGQIFCNRCCNQEVSGKTFGYNGNLRTCRYCFSFVAKYNAGELKMISENTDIHPNATMQSKKITLFPSKSSVSLNTCKALFNDEPLNQQSDSFNVIDFPTSTIKAVKSYDEQIKPYDSTSDYRLKFLDFERNSLAQKSDSLSSIWNTNALSNSDIGSLYDNIDSSSTNFYEFGEADNINPQNLLTYLSHVYKIMMNPVNGLKLTSNRVILKTYPNTIIGSSITKWLHTYIMKKYQSANNNPDLAPQSRSQTKNNVTHSADICRELSLALAKALLDFNYIEYVLGGGSSDTIMTSNIISGPKYAPVKGLIGCDLDNEQPFKETEIYRPGLASVKGNALLKESALRFYLLKNSVLFSLPPFIVAQDHAVEHGVDSDVLDFASKPVSPTLNDLKMTSEVDNILTTTTPHPHENITQQLQVKLNLDSNTTQILNKIITNEIDPSKLLLPTNAYTSSIAQFLDDFLWEVISQTLLYNNIYDNVSLTHTNSTQQHSNNLTGVRRRAILAKYIHALSLFAFSTLNKNGNDTNAGHPNDTSCNNKNNNDTRYKTNFNVMENVKIKMIHHKCYNDNASSINDLAKVIDGEKLYEYWCSDGMNPFFHVFPGIVFKHNLIHDSMIAMANTLPNAVHDDETFDSQYPLWLPNSCIKKSGTCKPLLSLKHPTILLFTGPIEYQRGSQQQKQHKNGGGLKAVAATSVFTEQKKFTSLEPILLQEHEYLRNFCNNIARLRPDLILVQGMISYLARQCLIDFNIPFIYNLAKSTLLHKIASVTGATIVPGLVESGQLLLIKPRMGVCKAFHIVSMASGCGRSENNTFIFIEICPSIQPIIPIVKDKSTTFGQQSFVNTHPYHLDYMTILVNDYNYYKKIKLLLKICIYLAQHLTCFKVFLTTQMHTLSIEYELSNDFLINHPLVSYKYFVEGQDEDEILMQEKKFINLLKLKDTLLSQCDEPIKIDNTECMELIQNKVTKSSGKLSRYEAYQVLLKHIILTCNPLVTFKPPFLDTKYEIGGHLTKYLPKNLYYSPTNYNSFLNNKKICLPKKHVKTKFFDPKELSPHDFISLFRYDENLFKESMDQNKNDERQEKNTDEPPSFFIDSFAIDQMQLMEVLFYSFVPNIQQYMGYCISPRIIPIHFYGLHDISLGTFLNQFCFNTSYICPNKRCKALGMDHVRRFVHDDTSLNVIIIKKKPNDNNATNSVNSNIKEFNSTLKSTNERNTQHRLNTPIDYVQYCGKCGILLSYSPNIIANLGSQLSMGAFIQNLIYSKDDLTNITSRSFLTHPLFYEKSYHICRSDVSHNPDTNIQNTMKMPETLNIVHCFNQNNNVAMFLPCPIILGSLIFPPYYIKYLQSSEFNKRIYCEEIEKFTVDNHNTFDSIIKKIVDLQNVCLSNNSVIDPVRPNFGTILQKTKDYLCDIEKEKTTIKNLIDQAQLQLSQSIDNGNFDISQKDMIDSFLSIENTINEGKSLLTQSVYFWNKHLLDLHNLRTEKWTGRVERSDAINNDSKKVSSALSTISGQIDCKYIDNKKVTGVENINNAIVSTLPPNKDKEIFATNLKSIITSWINNSGFEPIMCPYPPTQHSNLPYAGPNFCRVIITDDNACSIVAYSLSCMEYQTKIKATPMTTNSDCSFINLNSANELNSDTISDINEKYHIETNFCDNITNYKFNCKIYYAADFKAFREKMFPAGEVQFCRSLSKASKWISTGGKSGSTFLRTHDERFLIKQMSRMELQSFLTFAPHYMRYVENCNDEIGSQITSLAKIVGAYRISYKTGNSTITTKQDVLVMENLFYDRKNIQTVFDLKGSLRNRLVEIKELKVLNKGANSSGELNNNNVKSSLINIEIESDAQTFKHQESDNRGMGNRTSDVSVVLMDENFIRLTLDSPLYIRPHSKLILMTVLDRDTAFLSSHEVMDYSLLVAWDPSRQEYIVGLIDFIRTFTWDKKLEMMVKRSGLLGGQGKMPTIVSPQLYRQRFLEAMNRYFLTVPDHWYGLSKFSNI